MTAMPAGIVALAMVLAAGPAQAAEITGSIDATLAGEAQQWVSVDDADAPDGSYHAYGEAFTMVSLFGRDGIDGSPFANVVVIEFALDGSGKALTTDVSYGVVSYFPDGFFPHYTDDAPTVRVEAVTREAEILIVRGSFSATLSRLDSLGEPADKSDQKAIEGSFEARLRPTPSE
jgi:hypothetical protein